MAAKKSAGARTPALRRYAAVLRGVSPMNARSRGTSAAFRGGWCRTVRPPLSTGSVAFRAKTADEAALARKAEAAMQKHLGRSFMTIVRSVDGLQAILEADAYAKFRLA